MRYPILLLALTLLALLAAGVVVRADANPSPDSPTGTSVDPGEEPDVPAIIERESASFLEDVNVKDLEEQEQSKPEEEVAEDENMPVPAWEEAVRNEVEGKIDLDNLWRDPPQGATMLWRLTVGILRSRTVPAGKDRAREVFWQRCGAEVPHEEVVRRAGEWAFTFLAALDRVKDQTGVKLPVWGVFASHANEGGFDECALDFPTRKWASEHEAKRLTCETWRGNTTCRKISRKLVDKFALSYDRETVWTIMHDSYYPFATTTMPNGKKVSVRGVSDLGPWQLRTNAKKLSRAKFDRQTTMVSGVYMGAREMARRAKAYSYRFRVEDPHPRPWMLWPGWNPNDPKALAYDSKVTSVARWLGARRDEIERGFVILDTSKKKNRYRVERIR